MNESVMKSAWRFADAVRLLFDPVGIYLFGSHAKGCSHPGSDIDIAIVVPHTEGVDTNPAVLFDIDKKLKAIASSIDLHIEPHYIDNSLDQSGFINTVLDTGIRLSESGEAIFPDEDPLR